jgi:bacteriorhodopsin
LLAGSFFFFFPFEQFYFATCFATAISTFAYYAMLSGQGWLITPNCRQLFYVRYLEWFFSTPLILLDLGMIAGADVGLLAAILGAQMLLVFGGFMASISSGHIKWLWFVLSLMVFAAVLFVMIRGFRKLIERSHPAIVEVYSKCSWLSAITWSLYPVVFIFSVGTGDWSPNFEIMIYGVLDILSKSVFGFVLLLSHEGLDRITNFKSFAPINEAPMNYGGVGGQAPVESYI